MEFETIRKNTAPLMIVEQIIKSIENGRLHPEDKLPSERDLAKMFGVGRSSVREAIGVLGVMGYLDVIQGKGTFVAKNIPSSGQDTPELENIFAAYPMFDLMEARKLLEVNGVKLAADRADMVHIRKMRMAIARMEESGENITKFYEADLDFHNALAEATDNVFITQMMKILTRHIHTFRRNFLATSYETKERTIETANMITVFVAKGEGQKAAEFMDRHLGEVDASLKEVVSFKERIGGNSLKHDVLDESDEI